MAAAMEELLSSVKLPINHEKVYKEECMFSFDNPDSETGLYVCMKNFYGFGRRFVEDYSKKAGSRVFLHLKRVTKKKPVSDEPDKKKPTKMAIGGEGGFAADQTLYDIEEENCIVVLPDWQRIPLDNPDLLGQTQLSVAAILAAESYSKKEEAAALSNTWEGEIRKVSKHAETLVQINPNRKVPPSGWKCERCDLTTNLWLNLTDGAILCGRRYFDGTGGNNHAVEYFHETKYPLAVKLGTITPEGADVYSYDEDDMVLDPYLANHLAHFGIDIMSMKQTEKTMVEMEIDYNQKFGESAAIMESESELKPLYGPGYTGMHNLGNSCYINSCMQVLFSLPDFVDKYPSKSSEYFNDASLDSIPNNFNAQMAKLGKGLLSGDYSKPPLDDSEVIVRNGISPIVFKLLVGRGHSEFSSKKQQDAHEYLLHLFSMIERNCRGSRNPLDSLRFKLEERIQCTESKCVSYSDRDDYMVSLTIPMDCVQNKEEVKQYENLRDSCKEAGKPTNSKDIVRPRVSLKSCLDRFAAVEMVSDYYSSAVKRNTDVSKCNRFKTFPPYLILHVRKYTISENWTPKKLDVSLDVPDTLDLGWLRGLGRQPGETEFPPDDRESSTPQVQIDEAVVAQLVDMGFPLEGCKKAVFNTQNSGIEPAMNWVMEHMADADFSSPFVPPGAVSRQTSSGFVPNEDGLSMIMAMGFSRPQAVKALKNTDNNVERAADWIFSHSDELDAPDMETEETTPQVATNYKDGTPNYQLKAFISHMGTSTDVGHYVCHIKKHGRWVIYNDEKVAESQAPPKDLAYIYIYERQN